MYYTKFIMKNNFFKSLQYLYYFSLLTLFILYLFPGSLIGYFLYGNLAQQPNFIDNPIGTSINHFFFFLYLAISGLIIRLKTKVPTNSFQFLFCISILLELSHHLIPNRAFEYYDLLANILGVMFAYLIFTFLLKKIK